MLVIIYFSMFKELPCSLYILGLFPSTNSSRACLTYALSYYSCPALILKGGGWVWTVGHGQAIAWGNVDRCVLGTLARGGTRGRGNCVTSTCFYRNFDIITFLLGARQWDKKKYESATSVVLSLAKVWLQEDSGGQKWQMQGCESIVIIPVCWPRFVMFAFACVQVTSSFAGICGLPWQGRPSLLCIPWPSKPQPNSARWICWGKAWKTTRRRRHLCDQSSRTSFFSWARWAEWDGHELSNFSEALAKSLTVPIPEKSTFRLEGFPRQNAIQPCSSVNWYWCKWLAANEKGWYP